MWLMILFQHLYAQARFFVFFLELVSNCNFMHVLYTYMYSSGDHYFDGVDLAVIVMPWCACLGYSCFAQL